MDRLDFVPYQDYTGPEMTPEFAAACEEDMYVLCTDGTLVRGGRGVLFVFGELGWERTVRILWLPPMIWFVNGAYAVLSRNRRLFSHILFRKPPTG